MGKMVVINLIRTDAQNFQLDHDSCQINYLVALTSCSVLKIWNLNKLTGIIGVFNCQGAGHWPLMKVAKSEETSTCTKLSLTGSVCPNDVEFLEDVAGENWDGDSAVYAFNSGLIFSSLESFFPFR